MLKQFSQILQSNTRPFDIVFRNGGEEFTVVLPDCPTQKALQIAERIRLTVGNYHFNLTDGKKIKITASIGLSNYPDNSKSPKDLKDDADHALYQAKKSGQNRVCLFR